MWYSFTSTFKVSPLKSIWMMQRMKCFTLRLTDSWIRVFVIVPYVIAWRCTNTGVISFVITSREEISQILFFDKCDAVRQNVLSFYVRCIVIFVALFAIISYYASFSLIKTARFMHRSHIVSVILPHIINKTLRIVICCLTFIYS